MEKNKYTLYTIVILLVIFIPCSIYGTYMHIKTTVNLKHQFKFNNKLYFYENNKLLGTYECLKENCDYALFSNENKASSLINSRYAFIQDGDTLFLYDITKNKSYKSYQEVQSTTGNVFKVKQSDLWGAISISTVITELKECAYDDIDFKNNKLMILKDNKYIIYQGQEELFTTNLKIKDYNEELIIVNDGMTDKIYDYQNKEYLTTVPKKTLDFVSHFVLLEKNKNYYVYQFNKIADGYGATIIGNFYFDGESDITYELKDNTINFYGNETLLKSIEFTL